MTLKKLLVDLVIFWTDEKVKKKESQLNLSQLQNFIFKKMLDDLSIYFDTYLIHQDSNMENKIM